MIFTETKLSGAYVISLEPKGDSRGWFARTYCRDEFSRIGHDKDWMQINHSHTTNKGTVRGMHFQHPPFSEIKLIRCVTGAVYDVIVDIRKNSPTFLQWIGVELSAANHQMIYIPEGFAHGFQSMTDHAELIYHHSTMYSPGHEGGLSYKDPVLQIDWPLAMTVISDRDASHPFIDSNFKGI